MRWQVLVAACEGDWRGRAIEEARDRGEIGDRADALKLLGRLLGMN